MAINFDLLTGSIEDAATEANGYKHNQGVWVDVVDEKALVAEACGTAMCLFGFAAVRCGVKPPPPYRFMTYSTGSVWEAPGWYVDPETGRTVVHYRADDAPYTIHVADFARDQLGLSDEQASVLSSPGNTIDDLRRMRDALLDDPNMTGEELMDLRDEEGSCGCEAPDY